MKNVVKISGLFVVMVVLILITSLVAWANEPQTANKGSDANSKIQGRLSMQVDAKLRQAAAKTATATTEETGLPTRDMIGTGDLRNQQVFVYFEQKPSPAQVSELESLGVTVDAESWIPPLENYPLGFVRATIPIEMLGEVAANETVISMRTAETMREPLNDQAAIATNVDDVLDGSPGYDGTGVTIAVIDSGFEVGHLDFSPLAPGTHYRDYSDSATGPNDYDVANYATGHGTHVAGTALGRGTSSSPQGIYQGAAPNATPVLLKIGNDSTGSATDAAIVAAIHAAVDIYNADIITISYGGWGDYLDGSDADCQAIDYAVSQGAVVFTSAGNAAKDNWHYSGTVGAYAWSDWIQVNLTSSGWMDCNLLWYDGLGTNNDLELHYYQDDKTTEFTGEFTDFGREESPRGTEHRYYYHNTSRAAGTYYLKVYNNSASSQFFHVYYAWNSDFEFANPDPNYTIEDPATADGAIAVGSFTTRRGWYDYSNCPPEDYGGNCNYRWSFDQIQDVISDYSSMGPRVDGADKPSVVAPGSAIISMRDSDVYNDDTPNAKYISNNAPNECGLDKNPGSHGDGLNEYYVMEGTSMASPHVAGIAALILQAHPDWTPDQVRHVIESTATDYGAAGRDNTYGWGLINALAAAGGADTPVPSVIACDVSGNEVIQFAPGDTVYAKGSGPAGDYHIWIQNNPVTEGATLATGADPLGDRTPITINGSGVFGPVAIWTIPGDAPISYTEYDIVLDKQDDYAGQYNASSDGLGSVTGVGFTAPIPELSTIILLSLGMVILGGFVWHRRQQ